MRKLKCWPAALAALAVCPVVNAQSVNPGIEVLSNEKAAIAIQGRGQMIGLGEIVPDPVRDNARVFLFVKQARLGFKGRAEGFKFDVQAAFGGENVAGTNTDLGLLDFVADVPLRRMGENTVLKVGQFRVPYSREGLTDRGYMNFAERSIMNMASYQGRDYGLALQTRAGNFVGAAGVFSGGGRDVPQRYLPERLGVPEIAVRLGYDDGVDDEIYRVKGTEFDIQRSKKAAYLNVLYMQDTLIGHSTVLNVRTIDKNLLINSNYNQFIAAGPAGAAGTPTTLQRGRIFFVGGDAVLRHPLGQGSAVELEVEGNYGGYENRYGVLHIAGARAQGAYRQGPYQAGVRYAALMLDPRAGLRTTGFKASPGAGSTMHEITPALTWHIKGHNLKVVADAPVYLNMPIYIERGVGAYVFANQPDQITVLTGAGANTRRTTIVQGRMMFQFMF
ncbi:MAG: hypothetical protein HY549_01255 [Elusimicrobia bacterium]|nr:hypothetical protein [Elusimicrobiota bacterium]